MSKLTDKARRISFDDVDDVAQPAPIDERPRTAIGAITASLALGRGVEAENRVLKEKLQQFEDVMVVEFIDPQHIRPSRFANRHELSFLGPEFAGLKAEIASAGRNVQPIKVRRLPAAQTPGGVVEAYEIAFGHRRHRACLELGLPVAAIVEELSDAELFAEMERENRERQNLSPWEQGVMYKRALDEALFPSLRKLAAAIGVQAGNVSTAIQLAALPGDVVAAFPTPMSLQFRWAGPLKAAVDQNPDAVLALARDLAAMEPKLAAKTVLDRLLGAEAAVARTAPVVLMSRGVAVGSWDKDKRGNLAIQIKRGGLDEAGEKRLLKLLQQLLD
jgi:ParB family transcriptional regulator, chromosome partitioning protein